MSEDSDLYEAIDLERKRRHAEWKIKNNAIIKASRIPYRLAGEETILFRVPGKPKADFYPSTGRWRSNGKVFSGGATKFIEWYLSKHTT